MTIRPFYEPRILEMRLEKYAEIGIDGGLWLIGELLSQGVPTKGDFIPDPNYIYRPRHMEASIIELSYISEELRHRIFAAGFLKLPNNGAHATFKRLLETHTEMLHEAFRIEWKRRYGEMIDVSRPRGAIAIELLHKLASPR
jgi:hypothetical protein